MIDLKTIDHHPAIIEITKALTTATDNEDVPYFHTTIAYFLAKMAACMQCSVTIKGDFTTLTNVYVMNLSPSGAGKGTSIGTIEDEIICDFKDRFIKETIPAISKLALEDRAVDMSLRASKDLEECRSLVNDQYNSLGEYMFTFDGGYTAGIKQLRKRIIMQNTGAINTQIDEIGRHLLGSNELMSTFLELFDKGKTNERVLKNSSDNKRTGDLDGNSPANMLLFGDPSALLDGSTTEDEFYLLLQTGYARRCLFGYGHERRTPDITAEEMYNKHTDQSNSVIKDKWRKKFSILADPINNKMEIEVPRDVAIAYYDYKLHCMRRADKLNSQAVIEKTEMAHRAWKALKLAGVYSFINGSPLMTMDEFYQAVKLVEEDSAEAFHQIMHREAPYMKLAKFICDSPNELIHTEIAQKLIFYPESAAKRKEMLNNARAWAYKNNMVIRIQTRDDIEFISGERLQENDLKNLIISTSLQISDEYTNEYIPWDELCNKLPRKCNPSNGMPFNFINHHLAKGDPDTSGQGHGHRDDKTDDNILPEFNLAVIDVDDTCNMDLAAGLLADYKWIMYPTKRCDPKKKNRFRIILPLSHELKLDKKTYTLFMNNILEWLPFESDPGANQRSRKWNCNPLAPNGSVIVNDSDDTQLLDVLPFIPHSKPNDNYKQQSKEINDLDALERWFLRTMENNGGRNNNLLKYAYILKENGADALTMEDKVLALNNRLSNPLGETELRNTIFKTMGKIYGQEAA